MKFQLGDFLLLKDGSSRFISIKDTEKSVTQKSAEQLYKEGKIAQASIEIEGDPVFHPIEEYIQYQEQNKN